MVDLDFVYMSPCLLTLVWFILACFVIDFSALVVWFRIESDLFLFWYGNDHHKCVLGVVPESFPCRLFFGLTLLGGEVSWFRWKFDACCFKQRTVAVAGRTFLPVLLLEIIRIFLFFFCCFNDRHFFRFTLFLCVLVFIFYYMSWLQSPCLIKILVGSGIYFDSWHLDSGVIWVF